MKFLRNTSVMRYLSSSLCKNQYMNAHEMGKVDLDIHQLQSCSLTESPAAGMLKETWNQKVGKSGCVLCKIGAGENSGKGFRSVSVASLYFQQLK